mmetsp:Transcript_9585/g.13080  ORF Transcript_9585/g.13080 Transcript_9585/m.13080 type:complete len:132 (-) Transcript_9585:71-466(-)|eukprot:Macronucleus_7653.p1 GENE.Macronucleus_7653~~Macronucleus_7653.p1  ORF type:complete len:132 (+),score=34.93 Macronucleus_7653:1-396(+)
MAPIWDAFHERFHTKINVASVDCTSKFGKPLCQKYKIRGFPTLSYFPVGGSVYHELRGEQTMDELRDFVFGDGWTQTPAISSFNHKIVGVSAHDNSLLDELTSLMGIEHIISEETEEPFILDEDDLCLQQN